MLTIYSKANCTYCDQAKSLLESRGVPYQEVRIDQDPDARNFLVNQGHRSVPQIYKDGAVFVDGFKGLRSLDESVFQQLKG